MHVLITGGTGLFGKALVKGFLEKGCKVTFTSTNLDKANTLVSELGEENLQYEIVKFDSEDSINAFIQANRNNGFTHLVNNARSLNGLAVDADGYANASSLASEFFMAVSLPYLLTVGLSDSLVSVVNISSMYGVVPPNKHLYENGYETNPVQYGVAKAAQIHLTKELAVRFADKGVRVNAVSFGGVEGRVDDAFKQRYAVLCPEGKMLKLDQVFNPVWFALSDDSAGMTGHNLVVDGGWSVW